MYAQGGDAAQPTGDAGQSANAGGGSSQAEDVPFEEVK
jgi:molecular chaperone DnaK